MIKYIIRPLVLYFLINSFALYLVTLLLENTLIFEGGLRTFLVAGLILGLLNAILKPILKLISFPLIFLSAGLFSIVLNGVVVYFLQFLINALHITGSTVAVEGGFLSYCWVAIVLGVVNWLLNLVLGK